MTRLKQTQQLKTGETNTGANTMKIIKITHGYVIQTYNTDTGKCESQEFVAGDECEYEVAHTNEQFDIDDSETELEYQPYEMEQPK
mgnify:FL=1